MFNYEELLHSYAVDKLEYSDGSFAFDLWICFLIDLLRKFVFFVESFGFFGGNLIWFVDLLIEELKLFLLFLHPIDMAYSGHIIFLYPIMAGDPPISNEERNTQDSLALFESNTVINQYWTSADITDGFALNLNYLVSELFYIKKAYQMSGLEALYYILAELMFYLETQLFTVLNFNFNHDTYMYMNNILIGWE